MPRILVVNGLVDSGKNTELWPKPDSQCPLPNFPLKVHGAVGFWTAQELIVCGGHGGGKGGKALRKCFIYMENQWMPYGTMGTARDEASALQINSNQALIIGGKDENGSVFESTELFSSGGSEEGNKFPVAITGHCSFPFNSTHAMVTGGVQDGSRSANTWFVDLATTSFSPGPTMKTKRQDHGCSIFQHGNKSFGIVSGGNNINFGGYYGERLNSTEMIELDQISPTWTEGMQDQYKKSLSLAKVFFLLIFRSKITQMIVFLDSCGNHSRYLCLGWI